ncbi:FAD-binding domain-containing protein [Wenzhouxiangella marina]|uniref:DNA photolyase FAD-binding protein n=1 Tax=Wenzhouxiangella marina TaxID=1579979 RepID=A0A0K0XS12_9GAMM|nr:FAD-binding domain-containing protein [Wenzhouxiangella marina]AKS40478.1 DNA photolyase FAD-binding protein [Wenzhouxiangella marina]MBB6088200.1 deoxyribodipyrimidine photo-lyase [Wenzhouxiangella marina]
MHPTRKAGLDRLKEFLPRAGRDYARERNHDHGPGRHDRVSALSPWIRYRLITEQEVLARVLEQHSVTAAEKFVQEVCWRSYWKGWLQMRPSVWRDFLSERTRAVHRIEGNGGLARALEQAEAGQTGIEGFDDWAKELIETGYLHNHARMWFASIWIFTLKLPWTLGADFFLRHLIDADPASNTLSWRWVAGLQTQGKTYLARPDNIEKFTAGRFRPAGLATEAPALDGPSPPPPGPLPPALRAEAPMDGPALLLLTPEDLHPESLLPGSAEIAGLLGARGVHSLSSWPWGEQARRFVSGALDDALGRASEHFGLSGRALETLDAAMLVDACRDAGVDRIVTADAPVGPVDDALDQLELQLEKEGIQLERRRREWDALAWPQATKGFFPFKKKIPALLDAVGLGDRQGLLDLGA